MKRNRKREPLRFGTVTKSLFVCVCVAISGLGYVWQKNAIYRLGDEIKRREALLSSAQKRNLMLAAQLARLVEHVLGPKRGGIHPATRVFQGLRIAVNSELTNLRQGLDVATRFLRSGARIAVISFHSLEDRIVKQFFVEKSSSCICPPELPVCGCGRKETLRIVTRKPVTAGEAEVGLNPRARSAMLRVAEKI